MKAHPTRIEAMAVWSQRKETVDAAIAFSKEKCGCAHMELKREQRRALTEVLGRKDSVVVLPTGYSKSLIYLLLPFADLFVRRDAANGKFCSTSSGAAHVLSGRPDKASYGYELATDIYMYIYISNYGKRAAVTTLCNSYATVIITVLEKCKHYLSV